MIRKILLKILIRVYLKRNRDIVKFTEEEEFRKMLFEHESDVSDVLRKYLTRSTLTYWEATSEYERNIEKGGALMLKLLLDIHKAALLANKEKTKEKKIIKFVSLKNNLLAETTNQKTR